MAQETPPTDEMHYDAMEQDALRGVVKMALKRAASPQGMPGSHYFYITFETKAPGVSGPHDLLSQYPDEMTIVLQHQYRDLAPGETFFTVTLKFGGQPKRVSVPYAAVTRFCDPHVQYLLQFGAPEMSEEPAAPPAEVAVFTPAPPQEPSAEVAPPLESEEGAAEPKIVSLDQFRKK